MSDPSSGTSAFGPNVDAQQCDRLLGEALSRGGDYADLFFEHSRSGSFTFEDGRIKNVGRGVSLGMGTRVVDGEATGYAYSQDLEEAPMLEAARTTGAIASGGGATRAVAVSSAWIP